VILVVSFAFGAGASRHKRRRYQWGLPACGDLLAGRGTYLPTMLLHTVVPQRMRPNPEPKARKGTNQDHRRRGGYGLPQDETGWKRVSRRVGELASKRAGAGGPGGAPHALNDLAHQLRSATPSAPTRRDTRAVGDPRHLGPLLGAIPELRPAGGTRVMSLGISLPCQVLHTDLLLAFTSVYRS